MKLTRLRVAELRQFRQPFELADLQPGLNIFTGPNEAGKSTLVRAIRAAFFERHRQHQRRRPAPLRRLGAAAPRSSSTSRAPAATSLSKSFLQKKRCELVRGPGGAQAGRRGGRGCLGRAAGLPVRGQGRQPRRALGHPGPAVDRAGLGAGPAPDAVLHAADHLRKALDESLGDVSASGGDEVVAQVRKWRDELLTATGKPRGDLRRRRRRARPRAACGGAAEAVATYRGQVDQLEAAARRARR
jgi:hypothetical protein